MDSPEDVTSEAHSKAIEQIAYQKWLAAGCPQGEALCFWLNAEREWRDRRTTVKTEQTSAATSSALPG